MMFALQKFTLIITFLFAILATRATPVSRPNVIIINIDNHDKAALGYFGNTFIETPNIDKLFERGFRMQNFHTAGRCTSSRSALVTGRYHARNGAMGTGNAYGQTVDGVRTFAHVFKDAGYQTSMFGKWHMGDSHGLRPEDRGFDEVCSFENGAYLSGAVVRLGYNGTSRTAEAHRFNHNGTYEVYEGFRTDVWFREAMRYIEFQRDTGNPFIMYLATITAHGPHFGPEDLQAYYKGKYETEAFKWLRERFAADVATKGVKGHNGVQSFPYDHAADIASLDRNIGHLMTKLEALDLLKNTILVYMSDGDGSGPGDAAKEQMHSNELSGNPAVVVFPEQTEGKDIVGPAVANIDILPTFADICGIELSDEYKKTIDGQSFASLLDVENAEPWIDRFYINDHQSTGDREGVYRQMALKPLNVTTVILPNGKEVSWVSGKVKRNNGGPETIESAKKAYKKWFERVLEEFPLGAFIKTHNDDKPVFLRSYSIVDGPGGEGLQMYFMLDVQEDGTYEFDTNVSDYYGAEYSAGKSVSGKIKVFRKIVEGHLPVGLEEKRQVYRVLPETLAKSFRQETEADCTGKVAFTLKSGRYLINFQPKKKIVKDDPKPIMKLRIQRKMH
jgi:arylsulfatase A-like enzyme